MMTSKQKLFLRIVYTAAFLVILCVTLQYTLGRWAALKIANHYLEQGSLEANLVQVQFFRGPQVLKGVTYVNPAHNLVMQADSIQLDTSLLGLVWNRGAFEIKVDGLSAAIKHEKVDISLKESRLNILKGADNWPAKLLFEGLTVHNGMMGSFQIKSDLGGLGGQLPSTFQEFIQHLKENPNATYDAYAHLDNFPTELLESLLAFKFPRMHGILVPLVGSTFDLELKQSWALSQLVSALELNGTDFHMQASTTFQDDLFRLTSPATIDLVMTPVLWNSLFPTIPLHLAKSAKTNFLINTLQFPIHEEIELQNTSVMATLTLQDAEWSGAAQSLVSIKDLTVTVNSPQESPSIQLTFDGQSTMAGKTIPIQFQATIRKPKRLQDFTQLFSSQMDVHVEIRSLPTPLLAASLEAVLPAYGRLPLAFGDSFVGQAGVNLLGGVGDVGLELRGQQGMLSLSGYLQEDLFRLSKPAVVELSLSYQNVPFLVKQWNALLDSLQEADQPLRLTIDSKGFEWLFTRAGTEGLAMDGSLSLNRLFFKQTGRLPSAISLFVQNAPNGFDIWTTPLYFSLRGGILSLQRMDFLVAQQYPMAVWGSVSIPSQQLDLVLGLSGLTVKRAFGVDGIDANRYVQVPIKGSIDHPKLQKSKATAEIAAQSMQNQAGLPGFIIGTALTIASAPDRQSPTPPPTTNPLPWQALLTNDTSGKRSVTEEVLPQAVDNVGKGAKKILKGVFGL